MKQMIALVPYNIAMLVIGLFEFVKWLLFLLHKFTIQVFSQQARRHATLDVAWGQKFGVLPKRLPKHIQNKCFLIHCASMGEVTLATGLIEQLLEDNPDHSVVVTTNTLTGKTQLKRKLSDQIGKRVFHTYLPLDLPWSMWRLLRTIKPVATLIVEVELWPNLIRRSHAAGIPVIIVNARMTPKSVAKYKKLNWLAKPMVQSISLVLARNEEDYDGYSALGLADEKIKTVGNLKFDIETPSLSEAEQIRIDMGLEHRTVLIAGSTHLDEEEIVISAYNKLKEAHPDLLLIVVPRHPERFHQVLEYLIVQDLRISQVSLNEEITPRTDVLLVDKMGELQKLYGVADIAFVGGSIVEKGGHNPLEAAAYAKPVIMGPHIYNNPEVCAELIERGALTIANSEKEFVDTLSIWLSDSHERMQLGEAGLQAIKDHAELTKTISEQVTSLKK